MSKSYEQFLSRKLKQNAGSGFKPLWMPDFLFDFQSFLTEWSVRKGRAAKFADCGLGKTPMQLVWAENIVRKTNKPVLLATPLAVTFQTIREAEKFGIEAELSRNGKFKSKSIIVTNYERLHYFDPDDFGGMAGDESSGIKHYGSKKKKIVTEFMRRLRYRLLCTATAAPNDFHEMGTSSEALGYLGYRDMITKFFKQDTNKDYLGWGRSKYRFRGHAEIPFWQWVCSWARSIRKPSDLGFDDMNFILPPLNIHQHIVENSTPRDGQLFSTPARSLQEQREESKITLNERAELLASMVPDDRPMVAWCGLNAEADLLEKLIPNAKQVKGSMSDERKEELLLAFSDGELDRLITKPKIGCWGLNWQHCSDVFMFPSHSFEQYYQAIRRCWRFGQTVPVNVNVIVSEGEVGVLKSLQRKSDQADQMFDNLVLHMNNASHIQSSNPFLEESETPQWLIK